MKIGNANRNNFVNQTGRFSFLMFIKEKMKMCMSCFVIEYKKWLRADYIYFLKCFCQFTYLFCRYGVKFHFWFKPWRVSYAEGDEFEISIGKVIA